MNAHEPRQNMRLAEIAESPHRRRDDRHHRRHSSAFRNQRKRNVLRLACRRHRSALQIPCRRRGNRNQRKKHQKSLEEIRPADRQISSHEHIQQNDNRPHQNRDLEIHRKHRFKQFSRRHQTRCRIDREEKQCDRRRQNPDDSRRIPESPSEIGGNGQRPGLLRIDPEPRRDQEPVCQRSGHQADRHPAFPESRAIHRSRKSHQEPAAHVACLSRHRGHPAPHSASSEEILLDIRLFSVKIQPDHHHEHQVESERRISRNQIHLLPFLLQ